MTGSMAGGNNSKRKQRKENKKKKMAALLDIVKLNESDRDKGKKKKGKIELETAEEGAGGDQLGRLRADGEVPKKKLKTEGNFEATNVEKGPSGKPKLEGDALAELKKLLRERTNKIKQAPKLYLREMGENATLKLPMDSRCPLFLSDLQHLIMYSQIGVHSPYSPQRWCHLEKYNKLANVVVLILENVSIYHYEAFESYFQFTSSKFEHKIEIISPFSFDSDVVKELSMVPLSATQMRKLINEYGSLEDAAKHCSEIFDTASNFFPISEDDMDSDQAASNGSLPPSDKYPRTKLLLSGWQMIEENFPLPIKGLVERKYADYVLTKESYGPVTPHSPLFALDCEMCRTTTGELELTRVSVVNEKSELIYDSIVKPPNKIVDYLTRYSGITPKSMKNVTTILPDVQHEIRRILPKDAILVGQSLSNDLHALKMMHPYVIDTSVIYNISGDRTRKSKLQTLAREFLSQKIQTSSAGHCSSEDSTACMQLTLLKLRKGPYYGDAVMHSIYSEQRAYPDMGTASYAMSMLKQCVKANKTVRVVGVDDLPDKYRYYIDKNCTTEEVKNIYCIKANSNKEVIKVLCSNVNNHLNIGHLRIAQDLLQDENPGREKILKTLDKWVAQVCEASKDPALVAVVLSGHKEGGNGACFLHLKREFVV